MSLISVIIAAYNGEAYLAEAIESIQKQSYPHYEILVIDNGSIDRTKEIALSFSKVKHFYSSVADTAIARNQGVNFAQGDYLAFLDQDDLWTPNKLELQLHFLNTHPECGAVIGLQQIFLEKGCTKPHWLKSAFLEKPQSAHLPSALLVKKSTFEITGNFNTSFSLASDVAWFLKAKEKGIPIGMIDEVIVHRRIHGDNTSNKYLQLQKEILSVLHSSLKERRAHA